MTFGSLFTGVGGLDLGLERAGLRCSWQCEVVPYFREILDRRFPGTERLDDVTAFSPEPRHRVDLVCGGDPCQGNSVANSVHRRDHPDLASEFLRVVTTLRPRYVLRENPAVLRPGAPWPWHRFRGALESLGYAVVPFRLRACCLGLDHRRERLFLLAELPDPDRERPQGLEPAWVEEADAVRETLSRKFGPRRGGPDPLPAPRVCRGVDGVPARVDRTTGLGNAVCPCVGELIGTLILWADAGILT